MVIGLLAHVDAGKTTLSEALLYQTGQIRRFGRVDHGDAFLDTDEMERQRGITIFSKQARIVTEDWGVTLLDTPGHVDFSAEMERTLQVLDYAILVISGTDGVQGHTRTLWRLLRHYHVPVFLFINKMDLAGSDADALMKQLKGELSDCCVDFSGEKKTAAFYEELAVCTEPLLNRYMEQGTISAAAIAEAVAKRQVFPCFFGSALKREGIEGLLAGLKLYTEEKEYPSEFSARVYKIGRDERGVRLTFLKIMGGSLRTKETVDVDGKSEKVDQLRQYSGERYETAEWGRAGEVYGVTGLTATFPGQGLGALLKNNTPVLEPVLSYRMILPPEINPMEFMGKLRQLTEEDPQLYLKWEEELKEIHVQLMGQVQMEVLVRQIQERFGVTVQFGPGSIVYKETIVSTVEGVGHFEPLRHYAEVHLLLEPGERGSGIAVASGCSEDVLDKNWQRLIATHVQEREHRGVLTGAALMDVKVTILTGRAHPKHTEGGDFRQATYRAIRQGVKSAESVLLEPYYEFLLELPTEYLGRAMTDIRQRFGRQEAPDYFLWGEREMARIKGRAPVATMQDYVREVNGYTGGLGRLTLDLGGYDVCHNSGEVIEAMGYDSEEDTANPTGSVFCAHGAGYQVPWNEVPQVMHLPFVYKGGEGERMQDGFYYDSEGNAYRAEDFPGKTLSRTGTKSERELRSMSAFALDKELLDVYAREFGLSARDVEERGRRKWAAGCPKDGTRGEKQGRSQPAGVKYDKKGNPIYPAPDTREEYLIVDGYNIIFAWEDLRELAKVNIDSARDKLKDILCNYQGYRGCRLLLVFDAYKVKGNPGKKEWYGGENSREADDGANERGKKESGRGIQVVYTRQNETADAYIERTVHEMSGRCRITVATSDGLEQLTVLGQGALRMSAAGLLEEVRRVEKEGYEEYLRRVEKREL